MDKEILKCRLKFLAVTTAKLCVALEMNVINKVYVGQIIRCSSSSAANYRAACRAKSKADFVYKLKIVEEELDETMFFFEMLAEFNPNNKTEFRLLYKEANELLAVIVSSINTTIKNLKKQKDEKQIGND